MNGPDPPIKLKPASGQPAGSTRIDSATQRAESTSEEPGAQEISGMTNGDSPRENRNNLPWFRFWLSDYLSDPVVYLMSPADFGYFVRLLCVAWRDNPP